MGLDWNPGNKPKPGFEAEFEEILRRYEAEDYIDEEASAGGIFGLFGKSKQAGKPTKEALQQRFDEITVSAFETLDAPRIGHDEAATQWAREVYKDTEPEEPEEDWLESLKGLYVVSAVENCDGVPRYSNGSLGSYVEPFSFRGQFLTDCVSVIGKDMLERCYQTKTSAQTLAFGKELLQKAGDYARQHGLDLETMDFGDLKLDDLDFKNLEADLPENHRYKLDVVLSAGRWCLFWAERGHYLESYW